MFALLRHVGHTSRYDLPPRPTALRQHLDAHATASQEHLAEASRDVPSFANAVQSIHFGVVPVAAWVALILLNEQGQAALRALGEQPGLASALLVGAVVVWAALAS